MAETLISPGVLAREQDSTFLPPPTVVAGAAFIGPAVKGPVEVPTLVSSYQEYQTVFGTTFPSGSTSYEYLTSIAVKSYFSQGGPSALVTRVVPSGSVFTSAEATNILASGSLGAPFKLETIGTGVIYNNATGSTDPGKEGEDGTLVSGSQDNIRWEITGVNPERGTFNLTIRRGDDSVRSKIELETFTGLSLDPNSVDYIERRIGNQKMVKTVDGTDIYLQPVGEYVNKSKYVRVSQVLLPTYNYFENDGVSIRTYQTGKYFSDYLPRQSSGSFYNATGALFTGVANFYKDIAANTQGLTAAAYTDAIALHANVDEYRFNILSAPGLLAEHHAVPVASMVSVAENRGDCIVVLDSVDYGSGVADAVEYAGTVNSSYAATYWPWLQVVSETGKLVWVPAGTLLPGVYAFTDRSSAPWFSPAGLTRGGLSTAVQAARKVTSSQRNTLYAGNVNPNATIPGVGLSVFGQKTLQKKPSALDRVNVRRLLIEIKKYISDVGKTLLFEQNTAATRDRFLAKVNPYLNSVIERQGMYRAEVIMDETNNTSDIIDRNMLVGKIRIQPTRSIEYIILDFSIEPTGTAFGA